MPRPTTPPLIAARLIVGAFIASLLLSGCTPAAPPTGEASAAAPAPVESAEASQSPPPVAVAVGFDWKRIAPSGPLKEGGRYTAFSAARALWVMDNATQTVLHATSDGTTWRRVDLAAHGLPANAAPAGGSAGCFHSPVIEKRDDGFTIVYYTNYHGEHPSGLLQKIWLVDVEGDAVSVRSAVDNGLEKMPPKSGKDAFRTLCIAGFAHRNGVRYAIGEGLHCDRERIRDVDGVLTKVYSPARGHVRHPYLPCV